MRGASGKRWEVERAGRVTIDTDACSDGGYGDQSAEFSWIASSLSLLAMTGSPELTRERVGDPRYFRASRHTKPERAPHDRLGALS
jgi:hypothetical protein